MATHTLPCSLADAKQRIMEAAANEATRRYREREIEAVVRRMIGDPGCRLVN